MATPLRQARNKQGLTQDALAKRIGIAVRTLKYYEAGQRIPSYKTMKALARALHTTVERLWS